MKKKIRLYLDVCCYCRQFDDQSNPRISIEALSIDKILKFNDEKKVEIFCSELVHYEINKISDTYKRILVKYLVNRMNHYLLITDSIVNRGYELEEIGFKPYDALHISLSESCDADFLLTTDDKLIIKYKRHKNQIKCKIVNPIDFLKEME